VADGGARDRLHLPDGPQGMTVDSRRSCATRVPSIRAARSPAGRGRESNADVVRKGSALSPATLAIDRLIRRVCRGFLLPGHMPPGLRGYRSLLCVVTQSYAVLYGQNQTTGRGSRLRRGSTPTRLATRSLSSKLSSGPRAVREDKPVIPKPSDRTGCQGRRTPDHRGARRGSPLTRPPVRSARVHHLRE